MIGTHIPAARRPATPAAAVRTWPAAAAALLGLAALGLAAAAGTADDPIDQYAATAELQLQSGDGLQRLELPLAVLQASRSAHLADVRIFDAQGEPVPLAWVHAPPPTSGAERTLALPRFAWPAASGRSAAAGSTTQVQVDAAGAVVRIRSNRPAAPAADPDTWLLDLSTLGDAADERVTQLQLDWPARAGGLAATVRVEGSDDTRAWRHITSGPLLDLAQAGAPALKQVPWPASQRTPRYLRLHFDPPLALSRSDVVLSRSPPERPRTALRFGFTADAAAAPPHPWVLDLHGRVPLSHVTVHLPQTNSVTGLQLQQRDDPRQPWRTVTAFTAWRLTREGREVSAPATPFAAPAARYWQLLPAAGAGVRGPGTLEATLEWTAPQLVFAARGVTAGASAGASPPVPGLRLAVGRDRSPPAAVPLASLIPGYTAGAEHRLPAATLAPLHAQVVEVPGLVQRLDRATPADRQRWALWAILLLAVAGLGALAWRLVKDVNRTPRT